MKAGRKTGYSNSLLWQSMKKTSILVTVAVLWIILMVSLYYWGHKPFDAAQAVNIGSMLLDLLLAIAVTGVCGGAGRKIFGWVQKPKTEQPHTQNGAAEQAILQAAAGMGVLSLVWLLLGAAGLFYRWTAWLILLGGGVLLWRDIRAWSVDLAAALNFWRNGKPFDKVLIVFISLIVILQVLWAVAPPVKYDGLTYHLQLPRQYIAAHRFVFTADNPYWGHPQTGEMLFTWMMLLQRAQTAALLGVAWGVLTLLGTALTIRRVVLNWGQAFEANAIRAGLVGAIAMIAGFTFRGLMAWSYVDLLSALMGWAALAAVLWAVQGKPHYWSLWAGVFCAMAVNVKWTGGVVALVVFLFLVVEHRKMHLSWRGIFLAGALTAALVLPWLVKNILATGNPVYPYFFPTQYTPVQRLAASSAGDSSVELLQGLLFPFTSTVMGFDSAAGFGSDVGPLLALLALPGLWALRKHSAGRLIGFGLLILWSLIAAGSLLVNHIQQTRLFFAFLPWAAVAAGAGWLALTDLRSRLLRVETLLSAMLILVMIFTGVQELSRFGQSHPLSVVMGTESPQEYLADALGWYAPAVESLQDLPEGSKVLMLWEARGYYAPLTSTADLWIDRWRVDYWKYGNAQQILASWKEQGYTHLLYYKSGADLVRSEKNVLEDAGWQELDRLTALLPMVQDFGGTYVLYQLP
mgnify:CR=1 FL=1